jgi:hypothetical protein
VPSVLICALLVLLTFETVAAQTTSPQATADLRGTQGESLGQITFTQGPQEVLISISFRNRTALVGTHNTGIYATGRCDSPNFASAGALINQLSDLVIGPAGVSVYNLSAPGASLSSLVGRTLVVSQTDGSRVACGVVVGEGTDTAGDRPDLLTSLAVGLMGALLIVGGVLLRRRPQTG